MRRSCALRIVARTMVAPVQMSIILDQCFSVRGVREMTTMSASYSSLVPAWWNCLLVLGMDSRIAPS